MTNNELISIATKTATNIFNKRSAETGEAFNVKVNKINNNGANIHVTTKEMNRHGFEEFFQVGMNCAVYAIAGENKITEKIQKWYN